MILKTTVKFGPTLEVLYGEADLRVAEVAANLSVSSKTVYRLIHSGVLAHRRVLKGYRVPTDALEDFKRRNFWPSASSPMGDTPSSSSRRDVVFSDGSRPALRKPRRTRLN